MEEEERLLFLSFTLKELLEGKRTAGEEEQLWWGLGRGCSWEKVFSPFTLPNAPSLLFW